MRNVPIQGGREVGSPLGWDPATQGECLTLSVLQSIDDGRPSITTAWQFDQDELDALAAGGTFWGLLALPFVPLQRLWVQARNGEIVSDLSSSAAGVAAVAPPAMADLERAREIAAAFRAAVISVGRALEQRLGGMPSDADWQGTDNAGIVKRLARMVDRIPTRGGVIGIPLLTLSDIARGDLGRGKPFPGEPVDPGVQADLERVLGVELNPPPPPAAPPAELPSAVERALIELERQAAGRGLDCYGSKDPTAFSVSGEIDLVALAAAIRDGD